MNETQKIHPGGVVENSPGWSVAQPGECPPIRRSRPGGALRNTTFSLPLIRSNQRVAKGVEGPAFAFRRFERARFQPRRHYPKVFSKSTSATKSRSNSLTPHAPANGVLLSAAPTRRRAIRRSGGKRTAVCLAVVHWAMKCNSRKLYSCPLLPPLRTSQK